MFLFALINPHKKEVRETRISRISSINARLCFKNFPGILLASIHHWQLINGCIEIDGFR